MAGGVTSRVSRSFTAGRVRQAAATTTATSSMRDCGHRRAAQKAVNMQSSGHGGDRATHLHHRGRAEQGARGRGVVDAQQGACYQRQHLGESADGVRVSVSE